MEAQPLDFELEGSLCEIDIETSTIHDRCVKASPGLRLSVVQRHHMHGKRKENDQGKEMSTRRKLHRGESLRRMK